MAEVSQGATVAVASIGQLAKTAVASIGQWGTVAWPAGGDPIDIGLAATNRASNAAAGITRLQLDNPANDSGTITAIDIYCGGAITSLKVGTFYNTGGNNYAERDSASIGPLSAGLNEITGLSIDVQSGDILGTYWPSGSTVDYDTSASSGIVYYVGDGFGGTQTYILASGLTMSVYGEGST